MQEVLINGRWPLMLPEHRANFAPLTTPPYWEAERLAHMHERLRPGMMVVDVGSEEGDLSALYASWGCDLVLIEPDERVWPNVRAIWRANNLMAPLAVFSGFAGDVDRKTTEALEICRWPESAYGEIITDHGFAQLNERPDIAAIRLDVLAFSLWGILERRYPDAITIDSEGSELLVLQGAHSLLRDIRPLVWFSSHPEFQRIQYGYTEAELLAFLDSVNYRYELLAEDHERHFFAEPK